MEFSEYGLHLHIIIGMNDDKYMHNNPCHDIYVC